MTTPILTVAQAGALAAKAAMRLGVPVSVWTAAAPEMQQAAVEVASDDIYAEPGLQIAGRETDGAVQLATTVQAIHRLDIQSDPGAQERRRLQDGGVKSIQQGRVREDYGAYGSCGLCSAARQCLASYRGAVYLA